MPTNTLNGPVSGSITDGTTLSSVPGATPDTGLCIPKPPNGNGNLAPFIVAGWKKGIPEETTTFDNFNDIELLWEGGDSKPGRDGGAVASAWFDSIVFALDVSVCDIVCEMIATATSTAFFLFESKVLTNRCW